MMTTGDWLPRPINDEGQVVISTETRRGRTLRVLPLIFLSGFATLMSLVACFATPSLDYRVALTLIAVNLLVLTIGLADAWRATWGTWVIDDQFLEFRPCSGPSRRLSENEVGLIFWGDKRAVFRGASASITIPWRYLSPQEVTVAKGAIEKKLRDAFDFSDYSPPMGSFKAVLSIPKIMQLITISVMVMSIWIGVGMGLARWPVLPETWRRNSFPAWTIFLLIVSSWVPGWRKRITARTLHQDWPWRARRTASDGPAWRDDL
jgi:hypothetical protein